MLEKTLNLARQVGRKNERGGHSIPLSALAGTAAFDRILLRFLSGRLHARTGSNQPRRYGRPRV